MSPLTTDPCRRMRKVDKMNYDIAVKRCPCNLDGTSLPIQVCLGSCEMCLRDRHTHLPQSFRSSLGTSSFQNSGNHNLNHWRDSGSSIWTSNCNLNKSPLPNSGGSNIAETSVTTVKTVIQNSRDFDLKFQILYQLNKNHLKSISLPMLSVTVPCFNMTFLRVK